MSSQHAMRLARVVVRGAMKSSGSGTPFASLTEAQNPLQNLRQFCRQFSTEVPKATPPPLGGNRLRKLALGASMLGGGLIAYSLYGSGPVPLAPGPVITEKSKEPASKPGDYAAVRAAVADLLDAGEYDDGSYGPIIVRLAWHASGTYDKASNTGGSNGATMRYSPESNHGANNGLDVARKVLDPVKAKFPWISYADLWTLAGATAIEEMGGPHITWRAGRVDKENGDTAAPDGRLPDATKGAQHIRDIFYRMGFNDQEIVALSGAHTLGRCHPDRSGFLGPWTNAPTTFSNLYFTELTQNKWTKKKWSGPVQYEDKSGQLMMLPTDMALLWDKNFRKTVDLYAKDEDKFFQDFAAAFSKLLELGVPFAEGTVAV